MEIKRSAGRKKEIIEDKLAANSIKIARNMLGTGQLWIEGTYNKTELSVTVRTPNTRPPEINQDKRWRIVVDQWEELQGVDVEEASEGEIIAHIEGMIHDGLIKKWLSEWEFLYDARRTN